MFGDKSLQFLKEIGRNRLWFSIFLTCKPFCFVKSWKTVTRKFQCTRWCLFTKTYINLFSVFFSTKIQRTNTLIESRIRNWDEISFTKVDLGGKNTSKFTHVHCLTPIMGCDFRCENPVTSFKMEQKLTFYLLFADTVFKNRKSNPSPSYPLNNVVPLMKLPRETINTSTLVGRVEEGPKCLGLETLQTANNSHISFVASSSHFHAFHVKLRK